MRVTLWWLNLASLAIYFIPSQTDGAALQVMSAPNLLRVGTKENIFVEVQDYAGAALNVQILVKNHPSKVKVLTSTNVELTVDNNFQALASIVIPEADFANEDHSQKQYVYLQATFPDRVLEKVVLLSFQSGYIFIQTDKTIYTPNSIVNYRVFAVNPNMEPVVREDAGKRDTSISIEIMTPDNVTISREIVTPEAGIKSGAYKLQEIVSQGVWRVVCRFQSTPQQTFTAEFEVKEYVLPSFEITLTPSKPFFYVDDNELTVDIRATYLFGKEVEGIAHVVFGVETDNGKRSFPGSLGRVEISDGKGVATLTRKHITDTFPEINKLVKRHMYVTVIVLTQSGGEMGEAERKGIQIVTSPYTINFKRTSKYFKPGMPFDVMVVVTNPDESPAANVPLLMDPGMVPAVTSESGVAKATVNSFAGTDSLQVMVKTTDPAISSVRQASASMTATSYKTKTHNFLHMGVDSNELPKGENAKVNLNFGDSKGAQNHDITYLILSRGQLVKSDRVKRHGQPLITLSLPVTKEMMPSFRIVVYYHIGTNEIVSDSVWLEVKITCMGSLKLQSTRDRPYYEPRKLFGLRVTGDPGAKVGLVVVDKGVYVLNNKHRLTQRKVWDMVEKYDTGCTPGGGKDSMGVFYDAGLIFETNTASGTTIRQEPSCPVSERKRRAVTIQDVRTNLVGNYTTTMEKDCCIDGMKDSPLSYNCDRRSKYIQDGDACIKAFLRCCKELTDKRAIMHHEALILARSDLDDSYTSSNNIQLRSKFPESWLWKEITLPDCPANRPNCATTFKEESHPLQDTITTWQVTAISLSRTNGLCVADPFEMVVVKEFFIDLRVPYSAVRNEQLEIKAVLHNYSPDDATVWVELLEAADVCSSASKRGKFTQEVFVLASTSYVVSFIIIPMTTGNFPIEVKAAVKNSALNDGIRKILRVVPEGVLIKKPFIVTLDPENHPNNVQEEVINSAIPKSDQVPNTESTTQISVTGGEQMSVLVEKAVSGNSMGSLIVQPSGCGEQNMISMTLPLIATSFLDKTNQWEDVGLTVRNRAIQYINTGYQSQLAYRKPDGSYAAWIHRPSSAWLTAYVVKVFAMASDLVVVADHVICSAVKWLILNSQQPDGVFNELTVVIHGEMMGDVQGLDSDASMTAFILIAMQEARSLCEGSVNSMAGSMDKAVTYLEQRLNTLTNPYAVAMTSYALANAGMFNKDLLYKFSPDLNHWQVPRGIVFTREATAYALLALVKAKDLQAAAPVVKWLNKQRDVGGGYGSTQATIIVYQAIAQYWINAKGLKEINLNVDLEVVGRASGPDKFNFNKGNSFITRTVESIKDIKDDLKVKASGTGEATVTVVTLYYAYPKEKESDCSNFDLSVELSPPVKAISEDVVNTYLLKIEILYKNKDRNATMSILDIGMLTGFVPDTDDLNKLSKGRDRYIERYEMNKDLSERGSLVLYLDRVSHTQPDEIAFRIHKKIKVGVLQPAAVSVYEYYEQTHCVKFYHPERKQGKLHRLCKDDTCRCAEENCSMQKKDKVNNADRIDKACENVPNSKVDYVYKARVEDFKPDHTTDVYQLLIEKVIKEGSDRGVEGKLRTFIGFPFCRESVGLIKDSTYLMMGLSADLSRSPDGTDFQYVLGEKTWIEYWPTDAQCQTLEHRPTCNGLTEMINQFGTFGCPA